MERGARPIPIRQLAVIRSRADGVARSQDVDRRRFKSSQSYIAKMAQGDAIRQPEMDQDNNEQRLKYLDFVQVTALYVVFCFSSIYDYAKENSGRLKPSVQTVEGAAKTVIGPVYEKFHHVPFDFLKFVDSKVSELERHMPSLLKQASDQALSAAQKAPDVAQAVASEVQRAGVVAKTVYTKYEPTAKEMYAMYEPVAKEMYSKYEPVAEQYAVSAWRSLNRFPLFPQVAEVVVPTAARLSQKYNQAVCYTAERGYTVSSYLPLVPTERIAKVFGDEKAEGETAVEAH
ncbi:hypothetical protein HHK36_020783 [Tetracentron sinense]|uniref:Stress-related protein n=1 Tax=Tetracentron sinense TaxID=13715 RepID=A0A834YVR1_TETSI|nr:hypothetical protein HHK36_020783 [Tetracentron sinense]